MLDKKNSELNVTDLICEPPYEFKGIEQFKKPIAKEIWFIMRNPLCCPVCRKKTPMKRRHCQSCGANMGIPTPVFNKLVTYMMHKVMHRK